MKQLDLFNYEAEDKGEQRYSKKVTTPVYELKSTRPNLLELVNDSKTKRLIREIENSGVSEDEKKFLIAAATRHNVFHYQKIADYYAHSNKEMQALMEKSALVIIDFDKAIQYGYVKLTDEITQQYLKDYDE